MKSDTKAKKERRGKLLELTSKQKKKTVTPAQVDFYLALMHRLDISSPWDLWVLTTPSLGTKGKFTSNVRAVTALGRGRLCLTGKLWYETMEKKSSKNSKRGGGK